MRQKLFNPLLLPLARLRRACRVRRNPLPRPHLPSPPLALKHLLLGLLVVFCTVSASAGALVLKNDLRSPRNKERPLRKSTRLIVLHTTEAPAKSSLNKLSERGEAHYCLTEKGEAYRIVDRDREAFHAGRSMWEAKEDCDEYSIGIEVVGYHDKAMPLVQLEALKELLDKLKALYGLKDHQVVCHSQVAYGAPNKWYKTKHRGRKRCGMLFAMPSVRAKLGLKTRVAADPDVKAKRLIQADAYLNTVLYGSVDTMVAHYGKARPQVGVAPAAVASRAAPVKKTPVKAPKAVVRPTPPKPPAVKPHVDKAQAAKTAAKTPPPIQKPPLIVPKAESEAAADVAKAEAKERDWLQLMGLKGGFFKKDAKLIVPEPAVEEPETPAAAAVAQLEAPSAAPDEPTANAAGEVLPLPANLQIGRMGDAVKDLEALAKLPGYTRGGPVNTNLSPFKIAGAAWKSPSTYDYSPEGKIVTGDKVDEKSIAVGTFVFYRKQ